MSGNWRDEGASADDGGGEQCCVEAAAGEVFHVVSYWFLCRLS
jgi:hypothetical protein